MGKKKTSPSDAGTKLARKRLSVLELAEALGEEFLPVSFRKKIYTHIDQVQDDLDLWLHHYNFERPHQGYRNLGKRPFDTVKMFIPNSK